MADPLTPDLGQMLMLGAAMAGAGVLAGFLAGLLGVGGGIVIVPAMFEALGLFGTPESVRMHVAVGTSLATIVATAIRSARAHHSRGAVDGALLKSWGPAILLGVVLGSAISGVVSGDVLTGVFGVVALAVAVYMAGVGRQTPIRPDLPPQPIKGGIAVVIGLISSLMGIGGGTLSVPALTLCSYPIRAAVGTSAAVGLLIAAPGAIGFMLAGWGREGLPPFSLGFVNPIAFALIVPTTILVAPLGAKVAHAIPQVALRRAFAVFLLITGLRMLAQTAGFRLIGG